MDKCSNDLRKRARVAVLAVSAGALLLGAGGCETTRDPKDGPREDVSNLPWNRRESWEGNPYGTYFPGTR